MESVLVAVSSLTVQSRPFQAIRQTLAVTLSTVVQNMILRKGETKDLVRAFLAETATTLDDRVSIYRNISRLESGPLRYHSSGIRF